MGRDEHRARPVWMAELPQGFENPAARASRQSSTTGLLDISTKLAVIEPMTTVAVDIARATALFHALSDETRLAVLDMLRDGERCVCDLQGALDAAQSRLSFHLRVLRDAGLVSDRKEGRWSYYRLNHDVLEEVHDVVRAIGTEGTEGKRTLKVFGKCCG
jgi:ArsR family transcriptional regulator